LTAQNDRRSPWRNAEREIHACCAILDLLPRHVAHRTALVVSTFSHGNLYAYATVEGLARPIEYPQGVLSDEDFPTFAARHITQAVTARSALKQQCDSAKKNRKAA
jgi:hypothetical protein